MQCSRSSGIDHSALTVQCESLPTESAAAIVLYQSRYGILVQHFAGIVDSRRDCTENRNFRFNQSENLNNNESLDYTSLLGLRASRYGISYE
jgi:hypothetical protein